MPIALFLAALFGQMSALSRIVYILVGLSALWQIVALTQGLSARDQRATRTA